MRGLWGVIVLLFLAMAVAVPVVIVKENAGGGGAAEAAGDSVAMAGTRFSPSELAVRKGAEVVFDNDDVAPHTVTADEGGVDSGTINPGKAFKLVVREPFSYHCEIHPSMKATISLSG